MSEKSQSKIEYSITLSIHAFKAMCSNKIEEKPNQYSLNGDMWKKVIEEAINSFEKYPETIEVNKTYARYYEEAKSDAQCLSINVYCKKCSYRKNVYHINLKPKPDEKTCFVTLNVSRSMKEHDHKDDSKFDKEKSTNMLKYKIYFKLLIETKKGKILLSHAFIR